MRWLSAPACQPPCWEHITPGVTTLDEALDLLAGMPDVRDVSLESNYGAQWELRDHDFASVRVDEGVVQFLRIQVSTRDVLRLAEVIDIYGYPPQVYIQSCQDGYCAVDLMYSKHGMVVALLP